MENEPGLLNKDTSDLISEIKKATDVTGYIPLVMKKVPHSVKNSATEITYEKEIVNICPSKQIALCPYLMSQVRCLEYKETIKN